MPTRERREREQAREVSVGLDHPAWRQFRAELATGGVLYKNVLALAQRMQGHQQGTFSALVQVLATVDTDTTDTHDKED